MSPSPPPSFYRDGANTKPDSQVESGNFGSSSSRSPRPTRRIQFAAPPPPILSSVLLPPPRAIDGTARQGQTDAAASVVFGRSAGAIRRDTGVDPLIVLERRERAIQQHLQVLLDAQSAGLLHGFGGGGGDGESDAGSSTPTSRSMIGNAGRRDSGSDGRSGGNRGVVPIRQPKVKSISLRGARRGLIKDIGELVSVKDEELNLLDGEIEQRDKALLQVDTWEKQIEALRGQLSGEVMSKEETEDDREVTTLQHEERALETEIREMEDRLAAMQARKNWLGGRIMEGVNRREARLSSYKGALREAESETKQFLKRPPIKPSILMGGDQGFTALPIGRRTLSIAKDWWGKEVETLQARKEEVDIEREALEAGAQLWDESIGIVVDFENDLRKQMLSQESPGADGLVKQISKMEHVIEKLEASMRVAEEKGWNLLICALGAELEAFKQGEGILKGALAAAGGELDVQKGESNDDEDSSGVGKLDTDKESNVAESVDREESEDDGPPDFLDQPGVDDRDGDDTS